MFIVVGLEWTVPASSSIMVSVTKRCEGDTFYVDGVVLDSCIDCVISQAEEQDEGFFPLQRNGKTTEIKVDKGVKCKFMLQKMSLLMVAPE